VDGLQVNKGFGEESLPVDLQLREGEVFPISVFTDDPEPQEACDFVLAAEGLLSAAILGSGGEQSRPCSLGVPLSFLQI
jgi:hypothetical protein